MVYKICAIPIIIIEFTKREGDPFYASFSIYTFYLLFGTRSIATSSFRARHIEKRGCGGRGYSQELRHLYGWGKVPPSSFHDSTLLGTSRAPPLKSKSEAHYTHGCEEQACFPSRERGEVAKKVERTSKKKK